MPVVRSRLGDYVDGCARIAALLRREQAGLDLELANRLNRRTQSDGQRQALVVVDAVKQEVVGAFAVAV